MIPITFVYFTLFFVLSPNRQLPLLAAMLQGRAQYKWGELKHRNHLLLYTHVLGILELLQPFLFHQQYAQPFGALLEAYFSLIKVSFNFK